MKRVIPTLVLSAAVAAMLSTSSLAGGPLTAPVRKTLPNGLRVVVFPQSGTGIVQVQLTVEAGTAAESEDQRGVAPLVARLLVAGGTTSRTPAAFATDADRLGGSFVASANRENASIGAVFLPPDAEAGIELLSDAVINPVFDNDAFEKVRTQAVRELVRLHGDPLATAEEQLWRFAMPDVPAAREPLGDLASLFALTRESVRTFHRDAYRPDRALLAIAGDVTADRAFAIASEWFARWAGKAATSPPQVATPAGGTRILLVDRPALRVAGVCLGWRLPGRDADDDLARTVGASLLDESLTARLSQRMPAEAAFGVSIGQIRAASLLDAHFLVEPDSAGPVIERVRRAMVQARDAAPDGKRLAAFTAQVRAAYPMRFATVGSALAQWLGADAAGHDPDAALAAYPDRVAALRGTAVAAALERGWDTERTSIVVIGPAAKLRGPLAKLGTVKEIRLDEPRAASAAPAESLATPTAASEKLGREEVAKAIAAHGGLGKLRGIRDMTCDARIRLVLQGRELRGELRQLRKEPLKMVYLTSFENFESRQVLNGNRAWSMAPDGSLQDSDSTGVRALQSGFASDVPHLLLAAADSTALVVDRGLQSVDTLQVRAVDVTARGGQRRRLYFDPETWRLVAMDQNEESPRAARMTARRLYRDLRDIDGVLMPYEEDRQLGGQTVMQVFVTKFAINTDLSDDEFRKPGGAPGAPVKK